MSPCANASFDYLVGDLLELRWHLETQCFGSFEIDHKLIFRRCLHRHFSWFFALEDAIHIAGRTAIQLDPIGPIGEQAAGG